MGKGANKDSITLAKGATAKSKRKGRKSRINGGTKANPEIGLQELKHGGTLTRTVGIPIPPVKKAAKATHSCKAFTKISDLGKPLQTGNGVGTRRP